MSFWRSVLKGEEDTHTPDKTQITDKTYQGTENKQEMEIVRTRQNLTEPDKTPDITTGAVTEFRPRPANERRERVPFPPRHPNPVRHLMDLLEGDLEAYAAALRNYGPMSYGQAMDVLGWGATRAGKAEQALRHAGRITFNKLGRAVLVDEGGNSDDR